MRTILFLLAFAVALLPSCQVLDEQAWAQSTRDFMLASEVRHAAHTERMAAISRS